MNSQAHRSCYWLIACVVVVIISVLIAYGIERDFGKVDVQIIKIADPSGVILTGKLYRPIAATPKNKLAGVLSIHGYQNDKETQDAFAMELSRRGFVVLAIDLIGHGSSGGLFWRDSPDNTWGGNAGYAYLKSLAFVDSENIGVMGHSLGSRTALNVGAANPDHKAINPQCGTPGTPDLHNVLLSQARFDEFRGFRENQPRVEPLTKNAGRLKALGLTGSVEWNTTYGDFGNGTARRVALIESTHPGLTHNSQAVAETVNWMRQALKGNQQDPLWIPADQQVYMRKEWAMLIALLVTGLSIIPLANILLARPFFAKVAQPMPNRYVASSRSWWTLAVINTVIAAVTYLPITELGRDGTRGNHVLTQMVPWLSLPMGNGVMAWFLLNALIYIVLFTIWYRGAGKKAGVTMYDMGVSFDQQGTVFDWPVLGKTLLLGAMLFAWMYLLEGISEWALGIEFRYLWGFMRQFSVNRFGLFLIYLIPALIFFLLNCGTFLFGQARMKEYSTPARTQWMWWLKICFASMFGLLIVWAIQYVPYLYLGMAPGYEALGLPQYAQMWPLMLFVLLPEFAFLLFLNTWFFRRTGRIYLGALVVSSMAIWFTAAGSLIAR